MPLATNVDMSEKAELVECPVCGRDCWKSDEAKKLEKKDGYNAMCTTCAITNRFEKKGEANE